MEKFRRYSDDKAETSEMARVVERNVNALLHRKQAAIRDRTISDKFVDGVTAFAGSMAAIFFHFILFAGWVVWNTGVFNTYRFDPDLVLLGTFAAVEAIFLSMVVLIGQKRIKVQADKWAELDLQVSLLTEHELTRVMKLVKAIAAKMNISEADDKEIEELSKDIHPEKVLDTMEKAAE